MSFSFPTTVSKKALWTGIILSVLPSLLLLFSAVMKLTKAAPVLDGFAKMGFSESVIIPLGILELVCTLIYLVPRTAVLGAILLTGYLGGAIVTTLRVGDSYIMTVILGVMIWGGLYFRDPRVRALIPFRS